MGSKTARATGGTKGGGMGPMQSMAMAGNTGLASFSKADINKVQQAKQQFQKATGRDTPSSYAAIGKEIGELGSKYRRPVQLNPGLGAFSDGSGRMYTMSGTTYGIIYGAISRATHGTIRGTILDAVYGTMCGYRNRYHTWHNIWCHIWYHLWCHI